MKQTACDRPANCAAVIGTDPGTATVPPALTVYYDGACPLCSVEIAHYRRQQGADTLCFVNVAEPTACGPDLGHAQALARFHMRNAEGQLLSGAAAFVCLWQHMPRWRWLGRVAALPPVLALLELGYRAFLPLRPVLSRRLGAWLATRATPPGSSRPLPRQSGPAPW